jgi:superfamily II DNA or RNA helicase
VHYIPLSEHNNYQVKAGSRQFWTSERKSYDFWTKRLAAAETKKQEQMSSLMRMRAMMDFSSKEKYAKELLYDIEEKCIVFCNTMEQADRLCRDSYHSKNPNSEDNLIKFKNGSIDKLSCVLQLNEGVNIPQLKAGIILHAYGNERKSSQRIGRLLRLNPNDTSTVHVLCYKNTVDERWVKEALSDLDPKKITYNDTENVYR